MISRLRNRLTYANVMVTLLLFMVLGGGAYAAFHLPKNSVKSSNIVNGQVRSPDVKNNGLTGTDIKAATVAGTSRALVYNSGATTSLTTLATVKLGGDKFVFKGTCPGGSDNAVALDVNGPAASVRLSGTTSIDFAPPSEFMLELNTVAGVDTEIASRDAVNMHVNRSAGTAFLRKGAELIQVDFNIAVDNNAQTCLIRGTVTPGA